jgi:hypothetical protein
MYQYNSRAKTRAPKRFTGSLNRSACPALPTGKVLAAMVPKRARYRRPQEPCVSRDLRPRLNVRDDGDICINVALNRKF